MVPCNFHTHTVRCGHAFGTEREYIEKAIAEGFKTLGFSDHTPQPFRSGFVSGIRMRMDQLDDYVDTLKALRDEYSDRIELFIGLEVECYPDGLFEDLMKEVDSRDIDYLILGQHFIRGEEHGSYSGNATSDEDDLATYVDEVIAALDTGRFLYLAHPDLLNFTGDESIYLKHMERLCSYAIDHHIPLEVNGLGAEDMRWYPRRDFFTLATDMGCTLVYGADAHRPESVVQPEGVPFMGELCRDCNITFQNEVLTVKKKT